jgi:acetylornithine deacetylase
MLSDLEKRVLNRIDDQQGDMVDLLRKLIRFETVTPADGARAETSGFVDLQALVHNTLQDLGFSIETWDVDAADLERFPGSGIDPARDLGNMPVLVGKRAGVAQGRSLILNGHYDVVPPGLQENWRFAPLSAEVEDGRVYGRGACDMKGGIAAMLQAVKTIQESDVALAGDLTIQTVPDEEATSMGTLSCCQRGYHADAAIIPEPTDMKVLVAMRGSLFGTITINGRAGHADMTQPHWTEGGAVNAISKATTVIQALEQLAAEWRTRPDKQHKFLDPDTITPTTIKGGEWEVTVPEKVQLSFTCNFLPGTSDSREEIDAQLRRAADLDPWLRQHPPELETGEWWYGAEISADEPVVQTGLQVLTDLGLDPQLTGYGSLTDAIHLINYSGIPTISIGPDRQPAHMADEYVDIGELVNTTKGLALAIMRWCGVAD